MSKSQSSGTMLTVNDVSDVAVRIAELWERYTTEKRNALTLNEEARRFIYATYPSAQDYSDCGHLEVSIF